MGEKNLCQLHIWQKSNNQNLQETQKTKLPKNQWPNEDMGKWAEVFQRKKYKWSINTWKDAQHPDQKVNANQSHIKTLPHASQNGYHQEYKQAGHQWLMLVILITQEAEIRIVVQSQPK
jgi:fructosamine-3-kinase